MNFLRFICAAFLKCWAELLKKILYLLGLSFGKKVYATMKITARNVA